MELGDTNIAKDRAGIGRPDETDESSSCVELKISWTWTLP